MFKKSTWIILTAIFLSLVNLNSANAQASIYRLHSLFLYNFTKHIQWESVGDTFTIGVYGSDIALKEVKANLTGKKYSGKDIRVINVVGIGDANVSQMVYAPKSNKSDILEMFDTAKKGNTLFVSEDDLVSEGFAISFVLKDSKLGFKVSKGNLEASGLKISSSLLSLAQVVD